jgi:D-arabinose 1-dehydrogenase-like Zn-dependent alcohol dehydrogenase
VKAAVLESVGQPLVLKDIPVPEIAPDEVLIQTRTTGICGTDLHIVDGYGYVPPLPHVLGHEPAGVIAAVGSNVLGWKVGDRVVPSLFFTCNRCYYCRVGRNQQCAHLKGILGVLSPGAMAEYFKVPGENLFPLPESIPSEAGGLIADAVVTAVRAAKRGGSTVGSTAVVIGAGGVGLCLIQVLVSAGVRVFAADIHRENLEAAEAYGATTAFLTGPGLASGLRESAEKDAIQCVFDCVGSGQTLTQACDLVMNCGRVVVVGEYGDALSVTSTSIAQRELEIVGSRNGTRQDLVEAIRLVELGHVRPPIAACYPLEKVNDAIQRLREGVVGRLVVRVAND